MSNRALVVRIGIGLVVAGLVGVIAMISTPSDVAPTPSDLAPDRRPSRVAEEPSVVSRPNPVVAIRQPIQSDQATAQVVASTLDDTMFDMLGIPDNVPPLEWIEGDIPDEFGDGFTEVMLAVLDECQAPVRLLGIDCDEPPCALLIAPEVNDWHRDLTECDAWIDAFHSSIMDVNDWSVTCTGGEAQQLVLVVPSGASEFVTGTDKERFGRMHERSMDFQETYCASQATL